MLAAEQPELAVLVVDPGDLRTADASGRVPRRGHLRSAAARRQRARPARACSTATRPSGRYRATDRERGCVVSARPALSPSDRRSRRSDRPRRAASLRDHVRLLVAHGRRPLVHTTLRRCPTFLRARRPRSSSTRRPPSRRRSTPAPRRRPASSLHVSTDDCRRAGGWSSCARRRRRCDRAARSAATATRLSPSAAAPRSTCSGALPRDRRLWLARRRRRRRRCRALHATAGPIRYGYVEPRLAARRLPDGVRRQPGSAEMPSAGAAVHARGW